MLLCSSKLHVCLKSLGLIVATTFYLTAGNFLVAQENTLVFNFGYPNLAVVGNGKGDNRVEVFICPINHNMTWKEFEASKGFLVINDHSFRRRLRISDAQTIQLTNAFNKIVDRKHEFSPIADVDVGSPEIGSEMSLFQNEIGEEFRAACKSILTKEQLEQISIFDYRTRVKLKIVCGSINVRTGG